METCHFQSLARRNTSNDQRGIWRLWLRWQDVGIIWHGKYMFTSFFSIYLTFHHFLPVCFYRSDCMAYLHTAWLKLCGAHSVLWVKVGRISTKLCLEALDPQKLPKCQFPGKSMHLNNFWQWDRRKFFMDLPQSKSAIIDQAKSINYFQWQQLQGMYALNTTRKTAGWWLPVAAIEFNHHK